MLTTDRDGFEDGQDFSAEARISAERAHTPIGNAMRLAAKDPSWATENLGEMIYVYTLWILKRMGNDPNGRKINRRGCVEQELEMPLGGKWGDWKTISLNQRWIEMEESFLHRVFISPIEIWEIPMEWNQGKRPET